MREVGDKMDVSLKETGIGGVAGTPFGQKIAEKEMGKLIFWGAAAAILLFQNTTPVVLTFR